MKQQVVKRNDLKKAWYKAWQEVLFRQSETRFAELFVYFLSIAMSLLLTFSCWVWWRPDVPLKNGIMMAIINLTGHMVLTYETGYKKSFRLGRRRYFYFVWLVPVLLSVVGFIGGLFYRGVL